jgi:hypothetical protein
LRSSDLARSAALSRYSDLPRSSSLLKSADLDGENGENAGIAGIAENAEGDENTGLAELQVEGGVVYLTSPVDIAAFDIRLSGASTEGVKKLINNPDILFSIRKADEADEISVLAYSLGGGVIHAGRTPLFTIGLAQQVEEAMMADKSAQPIDVKILNGPTKNNNPPAYTIELFNAPNPFDAVTTFIYYLPEPAAAVRIKIYSLTGQLVEIIGNLPAEQGRHKVNYQNTRLPAGIYLYELESFKDNTFNVRQINKMWIIK